MNSALHIRFNNICNSINRTLNLNVNPRVIPTQSLHFTRGGGWCLPLTSYLLPLTAYWLSDPSSESHLQSLSCQYCQRDNRCWLLCPWILNFVIRYFSSRSFDAYQQRTKKDYTYTHFTNGVFVWVWNYKRVVQLKDIFLLGCLHHTILRYVVPSFENRRKCDVVQNWIDLPCYLL